MRRVPFIKLYLYSLFGILPLSLLFAILSLFHKFPIELNHQSHYGIVGFAICLLFTPLWVFIITCLSWSTLSLGRLIYTLFCKLVGIKIDESDVLAQKRDLFT